MNRKALENMITMLRTNKRVRENFSMKHWWHSQKAVGDAIGWYAKLCLGNLTLEIGSTNTWPRLVYDDTCIDFEAIGIEFGIDDTIAEQLFMGTEYELERISADDVADKIEAYMANN